VRVRLAVISPTDNDRGVFNHVGQCTSDLDRATRFYVEVFGFEVERDLAIPDEHAGPLLGLEPPLGLRARYLRKDEFVLELLTFDRVEQGAAARVMNETGLTHLSVSVEDLDVAVEQVQALGGELLIRLPNAVMVRDPDGQRVEVLTMDYRDFVARSLRQGDPG
jgi:lactoylglutathione lyase